MGITGRTSTRLAALCLLVTLAAPLDTAAGPSASALPIQTIRLPNGLTLVVVEDRRVPLVSVVTLYRLGAAQDPPGRPGLAHLVEHVLVSRWARYAGRRSYSGWFRGETGIDVTYYFNEVRRGEVGLALWEEAKRMADLERPADVYQVLAEACESARNEEEERGDRLGSLPGLRAALEALYPEGHPYRQILDRPFSTFQTTTAAEIQAFHRRFYNPANAVIALVGDVDAGEVQQLAQRYLGSLPPGAAVEASPPAAAKPGPDRRVTVPGRSMVHIIYPVPGVGHADRPAITMLSRVLGPALRRRLVREAGVADGVSVDLLERRLGGWLVFEVKPREGRRLDQVVAAFDKELAGLRGGGVGAEDLAQARAVLQFERTETYQAFRERAVALLAAHALRGAARSWWTDAAQTDHVGVAELATMTGRYLTGPGRLVLQHDPQAAALQAPVRAVPASAGAVPPRGLPAPPPPATGDAYLSVANLEDPRLERFTLSNGLPVVLAPSHDVPRVDARIIVGAGDAVTPPAQMGLALATAKLSIRGYQSDQGSAAVAPSERGGRIWAETDRSAATIGFESLRSSLEPTLIRWTGALRRPTFQQRELEQWKKHRQAQRADRARDASAAGEDLLRSRLFPASSPRAWPQEGTTQSVAGLDVEDVRRFHRERYHPANATLVVAGDIERPELEALLEKHLGDWPARRPAAPPEPPPADPPPGPRVFVVDVPGQRHASVQMGTVAPVDNSIDRGATELLATVVDMNVERAARAAGLVYHPTVSYTPQTGVLRISASVETGRVGELLRKIEGELQSVRAVSYRIDGLQEMKLHSLFRAWESLDGIERELHGAVTFDTLRAPLTTAASAYAHLDPARIQRLGARLLAPERLVLVVAGDRKVIEPQLARLGKVTVLPPVP